MTAKNGLHAFLPDLTVAARPGRAATVKSLKNGLGVSLSLQSFAPPTRGRWGRLQPELAAHRQTLLLLQILCQLPGDDNISYLIFTVDATRLGPQVLDTSQLALMHSVLQGKSVSCRQAARLTRGLAIRRLTACACHNGSPGRLGGLNLAGQGGGGRSIADVPPAARVGWRGRNHDLGWSRRCGRGRPRKAKPGVQHEYNGAMDYLRLLFHLGLMAVTLSTPATGERPLDSPLFLRYNRSRHRKAEFLCVATRPRHLTAADDSLEWRQEAWKMSVSIDELDRFHDFAVSLVSAAEADVTWLQLFELWRMENPARRRIPRERRGHPRVGPCDGRGANAAAGPVRCRFSRPPRLGKRRMNYRLVIVEPAEIDVDGIYDYILQRSPQGAASWYCGFWRAQSELCGARWLAALRGERGVRRSTAPGAVQDAIRIVLSLLVYCCARRGAYPASPRSRTTAAYGRRYYSRFGELTRLPPPCRPVPFGWARNAMTRKPTTAAHRCPPRVPYTSCLP